MVGEGGLEIGGLVGKRKENWRGGEMKVRIEK